MVWASVTRVLACAARKGAMLGRATLRAEAPSVRSAGAPVPQGSQARPRSRAIIAAWVRLRASSLRVSVLTCSFTVTS